MTSAPGVITGVVVDRTGAGLAEARVFFIAGPAPLPDVAALTDDEGAFGLSAPMAGEYTIQCVADGYAPRSFQVSVANGQRVNIDCRLDP